MQGPLLIIQIWPHLMIEVPRETVNCVYQESQGFRRLSQEKKNGLKGNKITGLPKDLTCSHRNIIVLQCNVRRLHLGPVLVVLSHPPPPTQITRVQTKQ